MEKKKKAIILIAAIIVIAAISTTIITTKKLKSKISGDKQSRDKENNETYTDNNVQKEEVIKEKEEEKETKKDNKKDDKKDKSNTALYDSLPDKDPPFKLGDKAKMIYSVQIMLNKKYNAGLVVDGILGEKTAQALCKYVWKSCYSKYQARNYELTLDEIREIFKNK